MSPPVKALQPGLCEFAPALDEQQFLFDQLLDPARSLLSIAAHFQTSVAAISLFLSRPEISEQFASFEDLVARRTRLAAGAQLSAVIAAAQRVLASFESGDASCSPETALRASRILIRLANFASGPVAPRESAARTPRAVARRAAILEQAASLRHHDSGERDDAPPQSASAAASDAPAAAETAPDQSPDLLPKESQVESQVQSQIESQIESHDESLHGSSAGNPEDFSSFMKQEVEQVRLALEALKSDYSDAELDELFRVAADIVAEAEECANSNPDDDPAVGDAIESVRTLPTPREPIPRAFAPP